MRRYLVVFVMVLVVGTGLAIAARRPRPAGPTSPAAATRPVAQVSLVIRDGGVAPALTSVPKDHRVEVRIENHGTRTVGITLAGYEDRLSAPAIAPGARWEGRFDADRPGEDFAWLVDGQPLGRFEVKGSHLVEGHR